jgi:deoxyribodipyrimidine photo-lyase
VVEGERLRFLDPRPIRDGKYVLYWMQASQRTHYNHALLHASYLSQSLDLPLVVYFGLTDGYPEANLRHYAFMLEGLKEVSHDLEHMGIRFVIRKCEPAEGALSLSKDAAIVVCDMGYLRHQREWRAQLAERAPCQVVQVETDAIVPVQTAYVKEAYSAAVLRPRLHKLMERFMVVPETVWPTRGSLDLDIEGEDAAGLTGLLKDMKVDRSVPPVKDLSGGPGQANELLDIFLERASEYYSEQKNDPSLRMQSDLSPYLHFGHISPLYIALRAISRPSGGTDAFVEELFVRRELSLNFVHYRNDHDSFTCLPTWASNTLMKHSTDRRERVYSLEELEHGETHDPYWNAAQHEMVSSGKMHGYMRMYWGKKILEWTQDPREAFSRALHLNNKYELDGRDPNSYAGIAWCFGKHDRPWGERAVFGSVRYMNDKGLERKFDMEGYIKRVGYKG